MHILLHNQAAQAEKAKALAEKVKSKVNVSRKEILDNAHT
jgi:hypothetical protein